MKKGKNVPTEVIRLYFSKSEDFYNFWDSKKRFYVFAMVALPPIIETFMSHLAEILEDVENTGKNYIDVEIFGSRQWCFNQNGKRIIEVKDPFLDRFSLNSYKFMQIL